MRERYDRDYPPSRRRLGAEMVDARLTNQEKRVEHDEEKGDIKPTVGRLTFVEVGDQNAQSNKACGSEECSGTANG